MQAWWHATSAEEVTVEGPLQEVHLLDKEVAFIAPVGFYQRGRNFIWHAILVRPRLQAVRELAAPVGNKLSVQDIDGDGVSEVISESVASGQGTTETARAIFHLDGFTPVLLHTAISEDNLGQCHRRCKQVDIDWQFRPSRSGGDGVVLTETVTTRTGTAGPDDLKARKQVKRYVLVGGTFVRADARSLQAE